MKILLVGNYSKDKQESMQRFANTLVKGLKKQGHKVRLIRPEPFFGKLVNSNFGIGKWLGYIDKLLIFPIRLKEEIKWADVVHIIDHGNSFYIKYLKNKPDIITCHDLIAIKTALGKFPNMKTRLSGRLFQRLILSRIKKSGFIVCVSNNTKRDLLEISKYPKEKVEVIYNGLNYDYKPPKYKPKYKNYFVHVGNNSWYKNRLGVLKIFKELDGDYSLVMVGKSFTKEMKEFVNKNKLNVIELKNVPNKELNLLYSNAIALIYPSLEEGFGWPILEAQASGCPVFTTNKAPMTEVGGNGAIYFKDPKNYKRCAKIIEKNINKLDIIRKKGVENAKNFSTQNMINTYIKIYKKILNENSKDN